MSRTSSSIGHRAFTSEMWENECSICLGAITPPIYQCSNGHILCNVCENKLELCPTCRIPLCKKDKIRNRVLESILASKHDDIMVSCPNAHLGCHVKLKEHLMHQHAVICTYKLVPISRFLGLESNTESNYFTFSGHLRSHGIRGTDLTGMRNPEIEICRRISPQDMQNRHRLFEPTFIQFGESVLFIRSRYIARPPGLLVFTILESPWGTIGQKYSVNVEINAKELDESWSWKGKPISMNGVKPDADLTSFVIRPSSSSSFTTKQQGDLIPVLCWTMRISLHRNSRFPSFINNLNSGIVSNSRSSSLPAQLIPAVTMTVTLSLLIFTAFRCYKRGNAAINQVQLQWVPERAFSSYIY